MSSLQFFGAAGEVTGSCHLVRMAGCTFLVDCGMFQGMGRQTDALNRQFGFDVGEITAMIFKPGFSPIEQYTDNYPQGPWTDLYALAGVMYAANYGTVQHTMGFLPGLKAFTAAVFGGIGNLTGAMVGGVLLGLIEAIGAGYLGTLTGGIFGSQYVEIFAFLVLILVLTVRPQGLMGERVADRA